MSASDFHETRRTIIGSSDAAKVLQQSQWGGPYDVWKEKVDPAPDHRPEDPTGHMARGRDLEPVVAQLYARIEDRPLRRAPLRRHSEYPFIGAHIDRELLSDGERPTETLEIKCPARNNLDRVKGANIPQDWLLQVQHQLLVTGHPRAVLAVLDWEAWDILRFVIEPHPEIQAVMLDAYPKFWQYVETKTHPELPEPIVPVDDIAITEQSEYAIIVDEMVEEAVFHILKAKEMAKRAGQIREREQQRVKEFLEKRNLHKIQLPGTGKVNWTLGSVGEKVDWEAIARGCQLDVDSEKWDRLVEMHTQEKRQGRRFLTYPEKGAD